MQTIPKYVVGLDIETKSNMLNCFILSIGLAVYDVRTLECIDEFYYRIDPKDPTQEKRHVSEYTLTWWKEWDVNQYAPSKAAYDDTWGGKGNLKEGLTLMGAFIDKYRSQENRPPVFITKGPEFDINVINNALYDTGLFKEIRMGISNQDSARTIERAFAALQLKVQRPKDAIPHTAIGDAKIEGFEGAYFYNLLDRIRDRGIGGLV